MIDWALHPIALRLSWHAYLLASVAGGGVVRREHRLIWAVRIGPRAAHMWTVQCVPDGKAASSVRFPSETGVYLRVMGTGSVSIWPFHSPGIAGLNPSEVALRAQLASPRCTHPSRQRHRELHHVMSVRLGHDLAPGDPQRVVHDPQRVVRWIALCLNKK